MALHAIEGPVAGQIFFVGAGDPWSQVGWEDPRETMGNAWESLGTSGNLGVKTSKNPGFLLMFWYPLNEIQDRLNCVYRNYGEFAAVHQPNGTASPAGQVLPCVMRCLAADTTHQMASCSQRTMCGSVALTAPDNP